MQIGQFGLDQKGFFLKNEMVTFFTTNPVQVNDWFTRGERRSSRLTFKFVQKLVTYR